MMLQNLSLLVGAGGTVGLVTALIPIILNGVMKGELFTFLYICLLFFQLDSFAHELIPNPHSEVQE